jgi:hypothetical protein
MSTPRIVRFQVMPEADPSSYTAIRNVIYALDMEGSLWRIGAEGWNRIVVRSASDTPIRPQTETSDDR